MQHEKGFEDIVAQMEYEFDVSGMNPDLDDFEKNWQLCRKNLAKLAAAIEGMGALGLTCGPSLRLTAQVGDALSEAVLRRKLGKIRRG